MLIKFYVCSAVESGAVIAVSSPFTRTRKLTPPSPCPTQPVVNRWMTRSSCCGNPTTQICPGLGSCWARRRFLSGTGLLIRYDCAKRRFPARNRRTWMDFVKSSRKFPKFVRLLCNDNGSRSFFLCLLLGHLFLV